MFGSNQHEEHNYWMSYTDLTSGFMIIFIVLTLALLNQGDRKSSKIKTLEVMADSLAMMNNEILSRKKQLDSLNDQLAHQKDSITAVADSLGLSNLKGVYSSIADSLRKNLVGIPSLRVLDDGTVRFVSENYELFPVKSDIISSNFQRTLSRFFPKFIDQINDIKNDSLLEIFEIRIEGHTDNSPNSTDKSYLYNLDLSSRRAISVYRMLLESNKFRYLKKETQEYLKSKTISCGYSFSNLLNKKGETYTGLSNDRISAVLSRRVEFKILVKHKSKSDSK